MKDMMSDTKKRAVYRNGEVTLTSLMLALIAVIVTRLMENTQALYWICPVLIVLNSLRYFFYEKIESLMDGMIRFRWLIAGIVFVILVCLHIHGSSINGYNILCTSDTSKSSGVLFGTAKIIRTDEYVVQVPYFFSQHYNHYQEISHQMSMSGQDMIIGYNSPVIDFTLIGKPFVWGYMLFGNEVGLSWYWCAKTILAIMAAFEMVRILTKNDRIALFGSFLIVFSPVMQWWFSPHMYDVFFWAMSVFDVGYYFFTAENRFWKIFTTLLAVSVLVGFVVALFPSLQVANGLCVLVLFIACLIRDQEKITFHKKDMIRLIIAVLAVGAILGHWVLNARDAIEILSNTAYPGKRVSVGGEFGFSELFTNLNILFIPFRVPAYFNQPENSSFIHLGVLCMLVYPYLFMKNRKDKEMAVGNAFFVIMLVQIEFMLVGFPKWLAKATLFSYINRMNIAYGFTACLFTLWMAQYMLNHREMLKKPYPIGAAVLFALLYVFASRSMIDSVYSMTFLKQYVYYIAAIGFGIVGLCMVLGWKRYFISFLAMATVLAGMFVNPVCRGIDPVTDHEYIRQAVKLNEEDEGYWISVGTTWEQNLLLANGMKTLNAVNYYPDFAKWEKIDPDGTMKKEYNRYAHISIFLTEDKTKIKSPFPDQTAVDLNVHDISTFGVKYMLTTETSGDLLDQHPDLFEQCYSGEGYKIYKVR